MHMNGYRCMYECNNTHAHNQKTNKHTHTSASAHTRMCSHTAAYTKSNKTLIYATLLCGVLPVINKTYNQGECVVSLHTQTPANHNPRSRRLKPRCPNFSLPHGLVYFPIVSLTITLSLTYKRSRSVTQMS